MSDQNAVKRFWFGMLEAGEDCSVVVYDALEQPPSEAHVCLFHLKRNKIVEYNKSVVRTKLRSLNADEWSLISYARSSYFPARAQFVAERKEHQAEVAWKARTAGSDEVPFFLEGAKDCKACDGIGFSELTAYGYPITCDVCHGWGRIR